MKKSYQVLQTVFFFENILYEIFILGKMMIVLLGFFFDHQCISKEIIFDWYENGAEYDYPGFQKAKLYAESFIDRINTNIESK